MRSNQFKHWVSWGGYALLLLLAPQIFSKGVALSVLSQMGTMMIFSLSYNMLLGQGGMLSFGHTVYSGLGAFCAIHVMNLASGGTVYVPVTLIPLVGGFAGMAFGILFGYLTTKKSGTTFSMITLGMVELVFASVLMLPEFFGGEGGISTNRVMGQPFLGITYGPQLQVYYLIAAWLFLSTAGMYAITRTPLGRLMNAVRDNPERVEFIGYDPRKIRYLTLILSTFFAGIAGGLSAINFEIVSSENVSVLRSGAVLLFTFIGGIRFFVGPLVGAAIGVFMTVLLSDFTKAWQLYLGILFIAAVLFAPGGITGIAVSALRMLRTTNFKHMLPYYVPVVFAFMLVLSAIIFMIEMIYHRSQDDVNGSPFTWFGISIETSGLMAWLGAVLCLTAGGVTFAIAQKILQRKTNQDLSVETSR